MDLGELVGSLRLEDSQFGQVLAGALDKLSGFAPKGAAIAATAGASVAVALGASLVKNLSVDAANDKLAAQLGLSASESEKAGKIAGTLYSNAYGESLDQVNEAVGAVMSSIDGMSDASAKEIEGATAKVLDFATAFEVDVTRAAQVAGQMISTGLAGDANEAFDLLVAGSQRVPAALREDLLDAVDEYGQFFATLGYSGEEAFAVLVDGSEKGMYGIDKAGDAIKEFTIRATDMSKSSAEAYDAIGMDAEVMSNKILAGGDTASKATQDIIQGLLDIEDPASQASVAIALFGTPLEDLNASEIPAFLQSLQGGSDAMEGFGGAADRMGATLSGNAATSLTSIKRQAEMFFIGLSNWALPVVTDITGKMATGFGPALDRVGDALGWVAGKSDALFGPLGGNSAVVGTLAAVISTVLVAALITWGIQSTIAGAKAAAAWTMTQLAAAKSTAVAVVASAANVAGWVAMGAASAAQAARMAVAWTVGVVAGATRSVAMMAVASAAVVAGWIVMGAQAMAGAARMAAAWLIALGPIGIAIAAIAGVVFLVVKYWDDIKRFTKAAWDWVVGQVKKVPGLLVGFFMNFTLPGLILKHWDSIKARTKAAWDWVITQVKRVPGLLVGFFRNFSLPGLIMKHWDQIKSGVRNGASAVVGYVRDLPGRIKRSLGNLGSLLLNAGKDVMRGLRDGIEAGLGWVRSKLEGVGRMIPGWLKKVLGIASPSKVMRQDVGLWIPAGIAEGVEAGADRFLAPALDHMAAMVAQPITASVAYDTTVAGLTHRGNVDMAAPVDGPFGGLTGSGPLVEQNIYPQPGQSEKQIGDHAGNRLAFAMQAGGRP